MSGFTEVAVVWACQIVAVVVVPCAHIQQIYGMNNTHTSKFVHAFDFAAERERERVELLTFNLSFIY